MITKLPAKIPIFQDIQGRVMMNCNHNAVFYNNYAIPSIFPDLPHYNIPEPEKRSETTTREFRFNREFEAFELIHQEFIANDSISSIEELHEKLRPQRLMDSAS